MTAIADTAPDTRSEHDLLGDRDVGAFVHLSGVLKRVAVKLPTICNDLRLLSSGPRAGLGDIRSRAAPTQRLRTNHRPFEPIIVHSLHKR